MLNSEEIENNRERNKIILDTFLFDLNFEQFQNAVSDSLELLNNELNNEVIEFQNSNNNFQYVLDINFIEEKLLAISEMKIIYLYKNLEINLKRLIGTIYGINTKDFYKFEKIIDFLKSKNINFSELTGFVEINEIRILNNTLKHSSRKINNDTSKIQEFKNLKVIRHYELLDFYERVKGFPLRFLDSLATEIHKDLYEFNEYRLNNIAELFALRMDKKTADKFIEIFKSKY